MFSLFWKFENLKIFEIFLKIDSISQAFLSDDTFVYAWKLEASPSDQRNFCVSTVLRRGVSQAVAGSNFWPQNLLFMLNQYNPLFWAPTGPIKWDYISTISWDNSEYLWNSLGDSTFIIGSPLSYDKGHIMSLSSGPLGVVGVTRWYHNCRIRMVQLSWTSFSTWWLIGDHCICCGLPCWNFQLTDCQKKISATTI